MTTHVLDLAEGIATADSRWSMTHRGWFFFVDRSGFEKIFPKGERDE